MCNPFEHQARKWKQRDRLVRFVKSFHNSGNGCDHFASELNLYTAASFPLPGETEHRYYLASSIDQKIGRVKTWLTWLALRQGGVKPQICICTTHLARCELVLLCHTHHLVAYPFPNARSPCGQGKLWMCMCLLPILNVYVLPAGIISMSKSKIKGTCSCLNLRRIKQAFNFWLV